MTDLHGLARWGCAVLGCDESQADLQPVPGDASFRRYFRLRCGDSGAVLCDAPPEREKNAEFVAVADLLQCAGLRAPRVLGADLERGWLCLEDLGDQLLLPLLSEVSVDACYRRALAMLRKLAVLDVDAVGLPRYDEAQLRQELELFPAWFCEQCLAIPFDARARAIFQDLSRVLCARALEQRQVVVHRDFHARNIMVLEDGQLATIDFQDAVVGAVTYDAVSLLRDCYVRWPPERVREWALWHRDGLLESGVPVREDDAQYLRDFDYMGLQRHIKVLGIFARLSVRDGKDGYLRDLPRVIAYVREVAGAHTDEPALAAFAGWFDRVAMPVVAQQSWYRSP